MKYTVLLMRPDYIADNYGQDTYLAHVEATTVEDAQVRAQVEANESDTNDPHDEEDAGNSLDYHVLFVASGHLDDLAVGTTSEGEER